MSKDDTRFRAEIDLVTQPSPQESCRDKSGLVEQVSDHPVEDWKKHGVISCTPNTTTMKPMKNLLKSITILCISTLISVAQAAPPTTFRCVDVITKRAFQFEIPADGKGDLTFLAGFPVKSRGKLPMTHYFSETTFRFGSEVEGGMFRNGIFYYHRHDTGTGTKIVSGTCRVI